MRDGGERVLPGDPSTLMEQSEHRRSSHITASAAPTRAAIPFAKHCICLKKHHSAKEGKKKTTTLKQSDWFETTSFVICDPQKAPANDSENSQQRKLAAVGLTWQLAEQMLLGLKPYGHQIEFLDRRNAISLLPRLQIHTFTRRHALL